jgi:hypothetical protein
MGLSGCAERGGDRARNFPPMILLGLELAAPGFGQPIKLCFAAVLRFSPGGSEPTSLLHAVQRRKKRARFYFKCAVSDLFDAVSNGEPVKLSVAERLQDQQIQSTLEQLGRFIFPYRHSVEDSLLLDI